MVNFMGVARFRHVEDHEIMNDDSIAKQYVDYIEAGMPNGVTWDDFFEYIEIPEKHRSNFAVAAILKQAQELVNKEKKV